MPRLASEGIVGADAIFACLGPALEIFSRYSRVEKASGEVVTLPEYLEQVWAAVSTEALSMIFKDADAAGLEPDARLTAMWLWTLGGGGTGMVPQRTMEGQEDEGDEEEEPRAVGKPCGWLHARIRRGSEDRSGLGRPLGADRVGGRESRATRLDCVAVAERTSICSARTKLHRLPSGGRRRSPQKTLFEDLEEVEASKAAGRRCRGRRWARRCWTGCIRR
jgi:putative DNA methylase